MKTTGSMIMCIVLACVALIMTGSAFGREGEVNPKDLTKTLSPYFFIEGGDPAVDRLPLKKTDVKVGINGVIADVIVTQRYVNEGKKPINARYVFPASTKAAVQGMKMIFGDQVITARIKEKEEAQKEFDAAKAAGKSASLLNQHRPNVFSMNVANIMPGDTIDIELHYTELLVPTDGVYEFVYPTVVGPRYSSQPKDGTAPDDKWIQSPYFRQGTEKMASWNIAVNVSAGMKLQDVASPSHETKIQFTSPSTAQVSLKEKEMNAGANRDFIIKYRLSGSSIQTGLMMYNAGKEKFFLLMVQPPKRVAEGDIPPREYIFLVDVSGSMHGYPLDISKELLRNLIGSLKPTDKFNVILFAGGSKVMSPTSVYASQDNIKRAIALIGEQEGGGGTELLAALKKALAIPRDGSYSRTVILATDGYIGSESGVFDEIRRNLSRTNFFGFGIGTSVNRHLMEGIATAGQGEVFIITKQDEAKKEAQRFCQYVRAPVLKDVKIAYKGFDAYGVEPDVIPEMFAERPLILIGKYKGEVRGQIVVSGAGGKGKFEQSVAVTEKDAGLNSALPYLWARTRIARLSDLSGEGEDINRAEVTKLGLEYSLLTRYTSFIAVRDVVRNPDGKATDVNQPLPLPKGVSDLAVGNSSVPEPEFYLLGILLIAGLGLIWLRRSSAARNESAR